MGHPIVRRARRAKWWRNACLPGISTLLQGRRRGRNRDINGLRQSLDYVTSLGCDAIWLQPVFPFPQRDHGYGIADYRDIDRCTGTLNFDTLLKDAHSRGLKILVDIVPNHSGSALLVPEAIRRNRIAARHRFRLRARSRPQRARDTEQLAVRFRWAHVGRVRGSADGGGTLPCIRLLTTGLQLAERGKFGRIRLDPQMVVLTAASMASRIDVAHGLVKADPIPRGEVSNSGSAEGLWNQPENTPDLPALEGDCKRLRANDTDWRSVGVGSLFLPGTTPLKMNLHQAFAFDFLVQPWIAARLRSALTKASGSHPKRKDPRGPWRITMCIGQSLLRAGASR